MNFFSLYQVKLIVVPRKFVLLKKIDNNSPEKKIPCKKVANQ
jgi:hypothetical protein